MHDVLGGPDHMSVCKLAACFASCTLHDNVQAWRQLLQVHARC